MNKFDEHINGTKPVIVDFFAEWCGPCKMMPPILHKVKESVGDKATILKMDIDKNPAYSRQFEIMAVPTIIIFKNGKAIWRNSGVPTANQIMSNS